MKFLDLVTFYESFHIFELLEKVFLPLLNKNPILYESSLALQNA